MKLGLFTDSGASAQTLRQALETRDLLLWTTASPAETLRRCAAQRPDLLLLQLRGPEQVQLTRQIMAQVPCPILLMTCDEPPRTQLVFEAMGYGALDVVHLPDMLQASLLCKDLIQRKISNLAWLSSTTRPIANEALKPYLPHSHGALHLPVLVGVGASAGGPATLIALLGALPADFSGAIVLVQHLDDKYSEGLASWLARESRLPVRLAQAGEVPKAGVVLLCGRNAHLCMQHNGELAYEEAAPHDIHSPSIDVFFQSLATCWQARAVGVLLTGMGRDGAVGLKAMRERGFHTIAQDQASSAVYGMPKAAADIDAAVDVLPLNRIAARLVELSHQE